MKTVQLENLICYHKKNKLEGFYSLNTSPNCNGFCNKMHANKNSICSKCFAVNQEKRMPNLKNKNARNFDILTKELVNFEGFLNVLYFRFHSFGELENITHLHNFINLTKQHKRTTFALYTKRIDLLKEYFKTHKKPSNLIIVVSSPILNKEINFEAIKKQLPQVDKTFTVYTKDYVVENDVKINCGGKKCSNCMLCYNKSRAKKNNVIRELVK